MSKSVKANWSEKRKMASWLRSVRSTVVSMIRISMEKMTEVSFESNFFSLQITITM